MSLPGPIRLLVSMAVALIMAACNKQPVLTTPSSAQVAFAESYPDRLLVIRTEFSDREAAARQSFDKVRAMPSSLRDPDYGAVQEVVRQADAAGRSKYYADEALSHEQTGRLFSDKRGALRRRIAGSVAFTAKEKEWCDKEHTDDIGAAAASATERAVERQLDQRLHDHNQATEYIEAEREALGERNIEPLQKHADAIAEASFMANVRLEMYRRELEELLDEEAKVRATLDRSEADSTAELAKSDLPRAKKTRLEGRVARAQAARTATGEQARPSRAALADLEARGNALRTDYETLIRTVLEELERKKSEPRKPKPASAPKAESATPPQEPVVGPEAPAPTEPAPAAPPASGPEGTPPVTTP
jgi:hypothetical protein